MVKQALLGKIINLGKDDLVQSVGQGGNDAAIDWRGISNYFQTNQTAYTITQNDVNAGYAVITVTWATPFADTDYVVVQGIHDTTVGGATSNDYSPGDVHNLTASGFSSAIYVGPGSAAGEIVQLWSLAIHN